MQMVLFNHLVLINQLFLEQYKSIGWDKKEYQLNIIQVEIHQLKLILLLELLCEQD